MACSGISGNLLEVGERYPGSSWLSYKRDRRGAGKATPHVGAEAGDGYQVATNVQMPGQEPS